MSVRITMHVRCRCGAQLTIPLLAGMAGIRRARAEAQAAGWKVRLQRGRIPSNHANATDICPTCRAAT